MRIIRNATPPKHQPKYEFDKLRPGDAFDVESRPGCREMFRRWCEKNRKKNLMLKYAGVSPDNKKMHRFFILEK